MEVLNQNRCCYVVPVNVGGDHDDPNTKANTENSP